MGFLLSLLILYIAGKVGNVEGGKSMGPVGNLIIKSVYDCPEGERPTGDELKFKYDLKTDQEDKSVSATATNKIDIDKTINYFLVIKRWENGSWKKVYDVKGKPCVDVKKYLPETLNKVRAAIKPDPGQECPIKAGTYSIENFMMLSKEIDFPNIFYGKLLAIATATDKFGKNIFCMMGEADSQAD